MTVKPVVQQEPTGCGIAASAALAGVSYEQARLRARGLGIEARDRTLWSDTGYVRTLLGAYGIMLSPDEKPFVSWDALPDRALLAIKWHLEGNRPFWHWVVFTREGGQERVLDSKKALKSNVRTDFGRIKPKWFIEVMD